MKIDLAEIEEKMHPKSSNKRENCREITVLAGIGSFKIKYSVRIKDASELADQNPSYRFQQKETNTSSRIRHFSLTRPNCIWNQIYQTSKSMNSNKIGRN